MSDFCRQCYTEVLGLAPENNDMRGLVSEEHYAQGYVGIGLCEGCCGGEFTPDGTCMGCETHPPIKGKA